MTAKTPPACPQGLGPGARRLWRAVLKDWTLDEHELALLREAVRTVDTLDRLAVVVKREGVMLKTDAGPRTHPALVEARQLRVTLARLLAVLRLPEGAADDLPSRDARPQRRGGARGIYAISGGKS